ncbi:MAG: insulinase family protein [Oscillospiraceae bacterium]|nr:insulinase family protein [Oscillospiraceae bacterium]
MYKYTDKRFKTNEIQVMLYTDFNGLSRSDCAAAAYILTDCCKKFPTYSELSKHLANLYSASLYSNVNFAWSGMRVAAVKANVLGNAYALDGENLEAEMCGILCECLLSPNAENGKFDETATANMRAEIIDDIDSVINEKSSYAAQRGAMIAFKGEPMDTPPVGTHEEAERITPETAYHAYRNMLETARIHIVCSGSSDFTDTERAFTKAFSKLERSNICELKKTPSTLKPEPAVFADTIPMEQAILRMYFKAPEFGDFRAALILSVILGGMTTSRFFLNIREKQSLCYYCACTGNRALRTLTAYAGVEPQNIELTKQAILDELNDIRENGVTEEELSAAKLDLYNRYSSMKDSPSIMIAWYHGQILDDEIHSPEEECREIEKVTSERIRAAARAYTLDTVYTLCSPDFDGTAGSYEREDTE